MDKITTAENVKIKNPKRVVQGKRLAATSREAKARKAEGRAKVKEYVDLANTLYLPAAGAITIIIAYGAYRYFYPTKKEEVIENQPYQKRKKIVLRNYNNNK